MRRLGVLGKLKILRILVYSIIVLSCAVSFYYLSNFSNYSTKFSISLKETVNDIDNKTSSLDNYSTELTAFSSVRDGEIVLNELVEEISTNVNSISHNYLNKNKFLEQTNKVGNEEDINLYNFEEDTYLLKKGKIINESNAPLVEIISNTKEDKANKKDTLVVDNSAYLSSKGLSDELISFFDEVYPVGAIYISIDNTTPPFGVWEKLETESTLWTDDDGTGEVLEPTLPNIKGTFGGSGRNIGQSSNGPFTIVDQGQCFSNGGNSVSYYARFMDFSIYNSIYKDGATVRPPAVAVTMFKRIG